MTDQFTHHVGRLRSRIGREFDERDLAGDGKTFEEFGSEHEGAVEHHEKEGIFPDEVMVDLIRNTLDACLNLCLGDVQGKLLVNDLYCFHT